MKITRFLFEIRIWATKTLKEYKKSHSHLCKNSFFMEAPIGFEPMIRVLQTRALPLGYGAEYLFLDKKMERETGLKPATFALATRRSIN